MKLLNTIRTTVITSVLIAGAASADDFNVVVGQASGQTVNAAELAVNPKVTVQDYINANRSETLSQLQVVTVNPAVTIQDYIEAANSEAR